MFYLDRADITPLSPSTWPRAGACWSDLQSIVPGSDSDGIFLRLFGGTPRRDP